MTALIVGRFLQLSDAEIASDELMRAGFSKHEISLVYVNPRGQRDLDPVGGDAGESPGAHDAHAGAMTGAAGGLGAGAVIGVATLPVLGPVGPVVGAAVGAYAGSLVGALNKMNKVETHESGAAPSRKAGILLAVAVGNPAQRETAIEMLRKQAVAIEETDGTLRDGDWVDFDHLKCGTPIK